MTDETQAEATQAEAATGGTQAEPVAATPALPPDQLDPAALGRSGQAEGLPFESLGRTWHLVPLGLARSITRARDSMYATAIIYGDVEERDVREAAYWMLQANYRLSPAETVRVLAGADPQQLADATCRGAFVHELTEEGRSYTAWARVCCLANGIDPAKVGRDDMAGVLDILIRTGRAITHQGFTAAGEFAGVRNDLISLI